jgi:glycosyltransferase involved in cell wall biosynthesis
MGNKLKRHDFFQNLYVASLKFNTPDLVATMFNRLSNLRLDQASYPWAKESDVFIYYRTQGYETTQRIHRSGSPTLCIMEEVNSHVDVCDGLMRAELKHIGLDSSQHEKFPDHTLRLKAYEESDLILCPSVFVLNSFLAKGFSPERLIKFNYGFPPIENVADKANKLADGTFRVLYVGQLHYRKGLRYAIDAFRQLKHPKKEFVIVGPKTQITGLEQTRIPDGVVFTGPLKGEALSEQYRRATVFVLPSIEDGFGLVVGEAMSFGLPVLITTNTGASDVVNDGVEGYVVPPGDERALAERLQQMADDNELMNRLSATALQTAWKLGSWETIAKRLVSELTEILANRS